MADRLGFLLRAIVFVALSLVVENYVLDPWLYVWWRFREPPALIPS